MDMLSYLHPPLRSRIISFLPTKEAMKLAILSSHWRHVSTSLLELIFTQNKKEEQNSTFRDCVDKALASHDETDIWIFYLEQAANDKTITESDFNRWITLLVQRNVRELGLYVCSTMKPKPTCLPSSLFTCRTLEELDLSKIKIEFPRFISFPKLKYFRLFNVEFVDPALEIFGVTSFPMLICLSLRTWQQIDSLSISIPSFEHLHLVMMNSPGLKISISTQKQLDIFYAGGPLDISTINITVILGITNINLELQRLTPLSPSSLCT